MPLAQVKDAAYVAACKYVLPSRCSANSKKAVNEIECKVAEQYDSQS